LPLSHPKEQRLFAAFRGSAVRTPLLAAHCFRYVVNQPLLAIVASERTSSRGSAVRTPLLAAHCLRRSAHAAVGCVLPLAS